VRDLHELVPFCFAANYVRFEVILLRLNREEIAWLLKTIINCGLGSCHLLNWLGLILRQKSSLVNCHFCGVLLLSRQHQLTVFRYRFVLANKLFLKFFYSVGVPQSVQSIFAALGRRRNVRNHGCFAVSKEGVFQNLGELAASERRMIFFLIKSSYALFQG